jgi:hypothetical protein
MLPKQLKYGSKVESAAARSYRTNIAPQNGTSGYNLGDTIIINIPTRANLVMVPSESYLKFSIQFKASANSSVFRWDSCGAHGLIQRIRVFHGSNLLQDIDNYGMLAKMLFDLQVPSDGAYGKYNILCGTRNDLVVTTAAAQGFTGVNNFPAMQINSGEALKNLTSPNNGIVLSANEYTETYTYCLNLISLVGSLSSQNYLPLFGATSAPLRVEIVLVDAIQKAMNALIAPSTTTISNVEFVGNFIELSDNAMGLIQSSLQGQPLQFVVPDYRNYQFTYSLGTSATQVTMPIPAKFSSLKSIFVTARDKGTGALTYFPYSTCALNIADYYFRVGSVVMPPKAPSTLTEMYAEAVKAIGSIADLNHQPSIEKSSYILSASTANTATLEALGASNSQSGSFYIGIDLENYASAPKDTIFAGYNSNTDDIYCILDYNAQGSAVTTRFDAFAMFDEVVIFDNNTAYVKF